MRANRRLAKPGNDGGRVAPADRSADPRGSFDAFFRGAVLGELAEMEAWRVRTLRTIAAWWAGIVPVGGGITWALARVGAPGEAVIASAVVTLVAAAYVFGSHWAEYRKAFKARLVEPMIRAYHGSLSYKAEGTIAREEFLAAGLFRELELSEYSGEDLITGRIGATALRFSEVHAENVQVSRSDKEETRRSKTIFKGLFFVADFNKHFAGTTHVLPDRAQRLLGTLGQSLQALSDRYGQLVALEDPEFERLFAVYASDQIEARYILSTALMQRIVRFQQRRGHTLRLAFVDTRLFVAISLSKNLFEPRLFRTIRNPDLFREFWNDLDLVTGIVEDLNLNTRIWTKT